MRACFKKCRSPARDRNKLAGKESVPSFWEGSRPLREKTRLQVGGSGVPLCRSGRLIRPTTAATLDGPQGAWLCLPTNKTKGTEIKKLMPAGARAGADHRRCAGPIHRQFWHGLEPEQLQRTRLYDEF